MNAITFADEYTAAAAFQALDLRGEAECIDEWEGGSMVVDGRPERAEYLYVPAAGVVGIAWGAQATWVDAESVADAIEKWAGI